MEFLRLGSLFLLLSVSAVCDVRTGKIPNRVIAAGYVVAVVSAGLGGGVLGMLTSVKMAVVILVALFFLYAIRGLGAGDVKLLSMAAAFIPSDIISVVVGAFVVGAVFSLCRMAWRGLRHEKFYIKRETIRFSVPVLISTLLVESANYLTIH